MPIAHIYGGCTQPDRRELDEYWKRAAKELDQLDVDADYSARWIGLDDPSTEEVIQLIIAGDKVGTFTLPWLIERTDQPVPAVGDPIILVDFHGRPRLIVRLTEVSRVRFGDISVTHTRIDGTPVRDLSIWKPLHTRYWNDLLAPWRLSVDETMPVLVEKFELLHIN